MVFKLVKFRLGYIFNRFAVSFARAADDGGEAALGGFNNGAGLVIRYKLIQYQPDAAPDGLFVYIQLDADLLDIVAGGDVIENLCFFGSEVCQQIIELLVDSSDVSELGQYHGS